MYIIYIHTHTCRKNNNEREIKVNKSLKISNYYLQYLKVHSLIIDEGVCCFCWEATVLSDFYEHLTEHANQT